MSERERIVADIILMNSGERSRLLQECFQAEVNEKLAGLREACAVIGDDFDGMDGPEFNAKYGQVDCGPAIRQLPNEQAAAGVRAIEARAYAKGYSDGQMAAGS